MSNKISELEQTMSAAAFAEAGEHDTAREMVKGGGASQSKNTAPAKKKPLVPTLIFGTISIICYITLFKNESLVTNQFTMGGWHAVYPVGTALLFSFIHGAFASNLLTLLGLEAKK